MKKKTTIVSIALAAMCVCGLSAGAILHTAATPSMGRYDTVTMSKSNIKQEKTETVQGKTRQIAYRDSEQVGNATQTIDTYVDAQENEYLYKGDRLIGFKQQAQAAPAARAASVDRQAAAESFLSQYITVGDYTLVDSYYIEDTQLYKFTYARFTGGLRTTDFAFVNLDAAGNIVNFAAPNVGLFADVTAPQITDEQINTYLAAQLASAGLQGAAFSVDSKLLSRNAAGQLELILAVDIPSLAAPGTSAGLQEYVMPIA